MSIVLCLLRPTRKWNQIGTIGIKNLHLHLNLPCRTLVTPASHSTKADLKANNSNSDWQRIYRFPLIPLVAAYCHFKIPYGVLLAIGLPVSYVLEQNAYLPPTTAAIASIIGFSTLLTMLITSYFMRNLIGLIDINGSRDKLRLAYVNYWGQRQNAVIPIVDLQYDIGQHKFLILDFYLSIHVQNQIDHKRFILLHRHGQIKQPDTFAYLFGE